MKKHYFNVTFRWSEDSNTFCSNLAHAENEEEVSKHYAKHAQVFISKASQYDVDEAKKRHKPIVEL